MSFTKKFLSSSILSVIDQGMLSGLNFLIGALLIRLVDKNDYGLYGQLYAGGLLAGLIIDSWIAGPLTTVASAVHENARRLLLRRYWMRQLFWSLMMGLGACLILLVFPLSVSAAVQLRQLAPVFGLYVIANGWREYGRTVGFIQSDIRSVLRQDTVYFFAVLSGLLALYVSDRINLLYVFLVLAVSSFLCALFGRERLRERTEASGGSDPEDLRLIDNHQDKIRSHGRWAVMGVIVGWLSNYSYVYLSGAWLGLAAIADLNASRLLLMPIPLAVAAWSRVARPEASRLIAGQNWQGLRRLTLFSILGIELVVLAYVAVLLLALPWLEAYVIGDKYLGLDPLIMLWGGYFAINSARVIGTSWLMSGGAFRAMFYLGSVTLLLVMAITSLAIPYLGAAGAVLALISVEVFEAVVVWKFIFPNLLGQEQNAAANAG